MDARDVLTLLVVPFLLAACDDATALRPDASDSDASGAAECLPGTLEGDIGGPGGPGLNLQGPGVDPDTGALAPLSGSVIVSTTYLTLRPEPAAQQRFGELMGPIVPALMGAPGLVASGLGTSEACGTARTITVWESESDMLAFVTSEAHTAAATSVGEVSRGGSVVTHWTADSAEDASVDEALRRVGAHDGVRY